ncbi:MAG TPA: hypothetical protein V6C95_22085 [Coleofasciculaceae cyanobacterium]
MRLIALTQPTTKPTNNSSLVIRQKTCDRTPKNKGDGQLMF